MSTGPAESTGEVRPGPIEQSGHEHWFVCFGKSSDEERTSDMQNLLDGVGLEQTTYQELQAFMSNLAADTGNDCR